MLIWVCAFHSEAKPVIDFYRLKKSHDNPPYDLYYGDQMVCVISGPGKVASAAASAWVAGKHHQVDSFAWINLGTAGAAQHEIGQIFGLNQIIDGDNGQRYYPITISKSSLLGHPGKCLSQASKNYDSKYLFDMESSGFAGASLRFSCAELIRSIKVVSDNQQHQTGHDRQKTSDLIYQHIDLIIAEAELLIALNQQLASLEVSAESIEKWLAAAHFSQTQKNQLRSLLGYLLNRSYNNEALLSQLNQQTSAKTMIESLQQISQQDSERL